MHMDLNIAEKFLLLAQHPEKGKYKISSIHVQYGLVGAIFLDLSLKKAITLNGKLVKANADFNPKSLEYNAHRVIFKAIHNSEKDRNLKQWIRRLSGKATKRKREFQQGMRKKNLIRIEHKKFLFIKYLVCYLRDKRTYKSLVYHLKNITLYKKEKNEKELSLLGLIQACQMQRILSQDHSELKIIRKELKGIAKDERVSQTVDATIRQIQAAIMIAVATSTAATAASR